MIKIWWLNAKKRNVQIQTRIHPKRWILLFITLNSIVLIVYVQYSRFIKVIQNTELYYRRAKVKYGKKN